MRVKVPLRGHIWGLERNLQGRFCLIQHANDSWLLVSVSKVARLLYTNSGVQRLWKWNRSEQNPTGKATASVIPQHWQPNSGLLMTNDVPSIALSKNDSYVMSACGGMER